MSNLILVGWDVSSLNKKSIINLVKSILEEDYPDDEVEEALDEFITDYIDEDEDYGDEYDEDYVEAFIKWLDDKLFNANLSLYSSEFIGIDFGTSATIGEIADVIKELNSSTVGKCISITMAEEPKMMAITD